MCISLQETFVEDYLISDTKLLTRFNVAKISSVVLSQTPKIWVGAQKENMLSVTLLDFYTLRLRQKPSDQSLQINLSIAYIFIQTYLTDKNTTKGRRKLNDFFPV